MEIVPAIIPAVVCGVCIYAGSIVINARVRPLNMSKMKMQAVVMPVIVFIIMLLILNM